MFESGLTQKSTKLRPLTEDEIQNTVRNALDAATDFRDSELSQRRELIDKYYQGETTIPIVKGRSQVVVTKVRDGVKSVIPSIARIFTQTDQIAEFYSDDEEDEKMCTDITVFCNSVFWKSGGYKAFIEAATDSLKSQIGVVKVSLEKRTVVSHRTFPTPALAGMPMMPEMGMITEESDTESVATQQSIRYIWRVEALPPEEFLIDSAALTANDAFMCAHTRDISISDGVEMGFEYEDIEDLDDSSSINQEREERQNYDRNLDEVRSPQIDPSAKLFLFTETYIRMDVDGDGIAELRRIACGGSKYKVLSNEPVNFVPYAVFKSELQPHVMHPICLAEDLVQDQDAQTSLLRSIINNTAATNNPRTVVNESVVNLEDVKNGEIGAIIRTRQMGQIEELATPFVAGQTLPVLQYLDEVSQQRSGITSLSQGLNSDALQSTTQVAAAATVAGSDARVEMMARNLGETGVKDLFLCILRIAMHELPGKQSIKQQENYLKVTPGWWHDQVSVRIAVGLGSGRIEEKKAAYSTIFPIQQQIAEKLGMSNPVAGWTQLRETLSSMLRLSGIHNTAALFPVVPEEQLTKMDEQTNAAAQEQQKAQKDMMNAQMGQAQAMVDMVKVEQQKNQLKHQQAMADMQRKYDEQLQNMQAEIMALKSDSQLKMTDIYLKDDRERDKMDMDFTVRTKEADVSEQKIAQTELKVATPRKEQIQ